MNHGLKINNNVLEITLPEEVHIDKVIVNREMFSQRQRVCESCKYHGLEGHEEPCVSCEVGNSNYVPSVGLEERTEERTETHACDCVSRQAALISLEKSMNLNQMRERLKRLPSAEPERKKGKWIYSSPNGFKCSECGGYLEIGFGTVKMNFCPSCGSYNGGEE